MKTVHLSDQDIQSFAINPDLCDQDFTKHIESCVMCKNNAVSYQVIFKSIQNQQTPVFDFDLTTLVMNQVSQPEEKPWGINIMIIALLTLSISIVSFTIFYFNNMLGNLINQMPLISYIFILSITGLIFLIVLWELIYSFNKKMKILELL